MNPLRRHDFGKVPSTDYTFQCRRCPTSICMIAREGEPQDTAEECGMGICAATPFRFGAVSPEARRERRARMRG